MLKWLQRQGMVLISAHTLDPFQKLQSFEKWDKRKNIHCEDETSYTTQYQVAILKYVDIEHIAKHSRVQVMKSENVLRNNLFPSLTAPGSGQTSLDLYDLSRYNKEYLSHNNVAVTTPGQNDCAACLVSATRLYLYSPPESSRIWGDVNPYFNDYHSNGMKFSSTLCILDIADLWCHKEETHSKYPDLSNVALNMFCIIPHGVGVEARFSLTQDVIGWRQLIPTDEPQCQNVLDWQFPRANTGILAGDNPELDKTNTEHHSEM